MTAVAQYDLDASNTHTRTHAPSLIGRWTGQEGRPSTQEPPTPFPPPQVDRALKEVGAHEAARRGAAGEPEQWHWVPRQVGPALHCAAINQLLSSHLRPRLNSLELLLRL